MKLHFKSFAAGVIAAAIGVTTVSAAGVIKSAVFNTNKIIVDGAELDLGSQRMISVVLEGETKASNYMPVRGVLSALGYDVNWDGEQNAVIANSYIDHFEPKDVTLDSLLGFWEGRQDNGKSVLYYFQSDSPKFPGYISIYAEKDGETEFKLGNYVVDKDNNKLSFEYFVYNNNEINEYAEADFRLSDSDNTLTISLDGASLALKRSDMKLLTDGVKQVFAADIAGKWVCTEFASDASDKDNFIFYKNGRLTYRSYVYGSPFTLSGAYFIEDGILRASYSETSIDGVVVPTGDPLVLDYAVGIKDNVLYLYSGFDYYELKKE